MTRKSLLLLSCVVICAQSFAPTIAPLMAQSQKVTGFSLTRIEFGTEAPKPAIAMVSPGKWEEYRSNGEVAFRFDEIGRTATSVDLLDRSRNFLIKIDLNDQTLSFKDDNGNKAVFNTITAAFAVPVANENRSTASQTVQPQPPINTAQANQDEEEFDPAAGSAPTSTNTSKASTNITTRPAFTNRNNNTGDDSGGGQTENTTQNAVVDHSGPWVQSFAKAAQRGNGVTEAVTWALPETIVITSPNDSALNIYFDNNPSQFLSLQKVAENEYSSGGYSAKFTIIKPKNRLELRGPSGSQTFEMSATADRVPKLTRDRFGESDKIGSSDSFVVGTTVRHLDMPFYSFKGEEMDLFEINRGKKTEIFEYGEKDYALDNAVGGKYVPYGLRGLSIVNAKSNQMETMISNAASFQKSMSYNFGASGGDPQKAGLGLNVAAEKTSGSERSNGSSKAYGLARIDRYVLLLDKPNMLLKPDFRYDVQQLAENRMSAAQFRENYGTHYAAAIHYGGIGKAEKTMGTKELKTFASESLAISGSGGAKGVSLSGGFKEATSKSSGGTSMFTQEGWDSTGGSGSMASSGWTVSDTDTVPIRYDMRPLSDLISPIFFTKEWDSPGRNQYISARQKLSAEITRYMTSLPKPQDKNILPRVYQLTFHAIKCVSNGDDGATAPAQVYGKITAKITGIEQSESVTLFDESDDAPVTIACDGSGELPLKQPPIIVMETRNSPQASFVIATDQLFEYDPSAVNYDEAIVNMTPVPIFLHQWNAAQPRTDIQGTSMGPIPGQTNAPDLRVRVSFKEIQ